MKGVKEFAKAHSRIAPHAVAAHLNKLMRENEMDADAAFECFGAYLEEWEGFAPNHSIADQDAGFEF